MSSRTRAVVALATLALVSVAGCGGSDTANKNDYVNSVNQVQQDFADSISKTTAAPAGSDPQAAAKQTFSNIDQAIDELIGDLKAVEPPDDVKDLHSRLIDEMEQFKTQLAAASDSLDSGDPQKLLEAQQTFAQEASKLGTEMTQTISDINSKLQE